MYYTAQAICQPFNSSDFFFLTNLKKGKKGNKTLPRKKKRFFKENFLKSKINAGLFLLSCFTYKTFIN